MFLSCNAIRQARGSNGALLTLEPKAHGEHLVSGTRGALGAALSGAAMHEQLFGIIMYMYACMHVFVHVCMYVCLNACMHVCVHVCLYICR